MRRVRTGRDETALLQFGGNGRQRQSTQDPIIVVACRAKFHIPQAPRCTCTQFHYTHALKPCARAQMTLDPLPPLYSTKCMGPHTKCALVARPGGGALKKLVLSKFHAGRVRLSENLLESIVLYCTVELLQTVHAHARILSVSVFSRNSVPLLLVGSYCSLG